MIASLDRLVRRLFNPEPMTPSAGRPPSQKLTKGEQALRRSNIERGAEAARKLGDALSAQR